MLTETEEPTISHDISTTLDSKTKYPTAVTITGDGKTDDNTASSADSTAGRSDLPSTQVPCPLYTLVVEDPEGLDIPSSISVDINSHTRFSLQRTISRLNPLPIRQIVLLRPLNRTPYGQKLHHGTHLFIRNLHVIPLLRECEEPRVNAIYIYIHFSSWEALKEKTKSF